MLAVRVPRPFGSRPRPWFFFLRPSPALSVLLLLHSAAASLHGRFVVAFMGLLLYQFVVNSSVGHVWWFEVEPTLRVVKLRAEEERQRFAPWS